MGDNKTRINAKGLLLESWVKPALPANRGATAVDPYVDIDPLCDSTVTVTSCLF